MDGPSTTLPSAAGSRAMPMSRRERRFRQPSRRNFWLHVLGAGGLAMAWEFGNPHLVLPWISHHLAVAYILVALLIPLYQAGLVVTELFIAPHIARVPMRKHAVAATGLFLAGLFAAIFVIAAALAPAVAGLALLLCAALIGLSFGLLGVAHTDLQAKTVARPVRGKAMAHGAVLGGALTLGASVAIWWLVPELAGNHLILLWLAVGGCLGFAAAHGAIQEMPSEQVAWRGGLRQIRRGLSLIAQYPWFKRFLILRGLLLSVELTVPFYAIHAATLHGPTAHNLTTFVVALSIGKILAGQIWGRLLDRHNALVAIAGALLAAAAGAVVLALDALGKPDAPFTHAFLFVPLAIAIEGVIQARYRWLSVMAPAKDRPAMAAFGSALLAFAGIVMALLLGAAGHLRDINTPLVCLILLNLAAAAYVPRAFTVDKAG